METQKYLAMIKKMLRDGSSEVFTEYLRLQVAQKKNNKKEKIKNIS
jgi:hypothetical protein